MGAGTLVSFGRPFQAQFSRTGTAFSGISAVFYLVQIAAGRADQHIQRVALVLGEQVTGEEVKIFVAVRAFLLLDPEEVFHVGLVGSALEAGGAVQVADLLLKCLHQLGCGFSVFLQVQVFDLAVDDPPRHGVDVVAQHVAPHPISLDQRGSAPHEGVCDGDSLEVIGGEKCFFKRPVAVFGEDQSPEQGSRTAGEPLVHGDDWPVVLLDLFFTQGQGGDEGDVEVLFYGHGREGFLI
jgi:hypothetical protein